MFQTILIANTAEAFHEILEKDSHTKQGKERINHELTLSQRAFFWGADDKIIVTPCLIPPLIFEMNKKIMGFENIVNLIPENGNIHLSSSVVGDKSLLGLIVSEIRKNPNITISSYAVTEDFLQLIGKLKELGLDFTVNEKPVNGEKRGVIITLISECNPVIGYIVIAPNRSEGQALQKKLFSICNQ